MVGSPGGPERSRRAVGVVRTAVKVRGLSAIDRRTVAARDLVRWQAALTADLGGESAITEAQRALVEDAARTKLIRDHIDATLMELRTLVRGKGKKLHPLVLERMRVAEHLAKILDRLGYKREPKALNAMDYLRDQADDGPGDEGSGPAAKSQKSLEESDRSDSSEKGSKDKTKNES